MAADDIITMTNVSVRYELRNSSLKRNTSYLNALSGITLNVRKGETLAVVGESGSGKSTLAMAILGLLKHWKGTIDYRFRECGLTSTEDDNLKRGELLEIWQRSSIVFQDPYSALDSKKLIKDIIAEPFVGHRKGNRKRAEERAGQLVEQVGLTLDHLVYYPGQLSGGQRQRIAVARTLINGPELIIFDEPTSSLDVSIQAQILNLILDLKEQHNLTYIFITHNLAVAKHVSDRIMVLYLGNVMEIGMTDSVFSEPLHPYTKLLISSVPLPKSDYEMKQRESREAEVSSIAPPKGCVFHPRCPVATSHCGWDSKEIIQLIERESYLRLGLESLNADMQDELNFTISAADEDMAGKLLDLIGEKNKFRIASSELRGSKIACRLYVSWSPRMVPKDDRMVNCILYDDEFKNAHDIQK